MLFYESEEIIQKSSKLIEVNCLQVMKSKQKIIAWHASLKHVSCVNLPL